MARSTAPEIRIPVVALLALALASCASLPSPAEADSAVSQLQGSGRWAWALAILLVWADVILPVPQTTVIAALGIIYGTVVGGLLGSFALITAGLLGYGLMHTAARRLVMRLASERSLQRMEQLFERRGPWAIVLSRSFPYSGAEIIVFLAAIAGMSLRKFLVALILGSVPTGFAFAAVGAGWSAQPVLALAISYVLPIILLPLVLRLLLQR